eukprot:PLAT13715.3.p1 GENE.PLAT13715.3~~PLAT13715.3.p1  ORF type:complete len:1043 (+),score=570.32 PLAT13715.3:1130-4258(+)
MKLRKHLRTRRLEDVRQLGGDRVIDISFGTFHVIVEFYARGNLILTDENYQILALLRKHEYDDEVRVAVRETYPVHVATRSLEVAEVIDVASVKAATEDLALALRKKTTLRQLLLQKESGISHFGSVFIEHALCRAGLRPNTKVRSTWDGLDADTWAALIAELQAVAERMRTTRDIGTRGYIVTKQRVAEDGSLIVDEPAGEDDEDGEEEGKSAAEVLAADGSRAGEVAGPDSRLKEDWKFYHDVVPMTLAQHEGYRVIAFDSLNDAIDDFFSQLELAKSSGAKKAASSKGLTKAERIRLDQQRRLEELRATEASSLTKAQLIEGNIAIIDEAIAVVKSAVDSGVAWSDLQLSVTELQEAGHPIAQIISRLLLATNEVELLLWDEEEDGWDAKPGTPVAIDITLTPYANARRYYSMKKSSAAKAEKTMAAKAKAEKKAAKRGKAKADSMVGKTQGMRKRRKPFWFEKFYWFISSDGYLVIGGRDATQNEKIVKRYMSKHDIYVHAAPRGAPSVVVKNHNPPHDIPPTTLQQAGSLAVCYSSGWSGKAPASAYWVRPEQVSKTAPTGEYLTAGAFMIRGQKTFLKEVRMEMYYGFLFALDDSSISRHLGERGAAADADDGAAAAAGVEEGKAVESAVETAAGGAAEAEEEGAPVVESKDDEEEAAPVELPAVELEGMEMPTLDTGFDEDGIALMPELEGALDDLDIGPDPLEDFGIATPMPVPAAAGDGRRARSAQERKLAKRARLIAKELSISEEEAMKVVLQRREAGLQGRATGWRRQRERVERRREEVAAGGAAGGRRRRGRRGRRGRRIDYDDEDEREAALEAVGHFEEMADDGAGDEERDGAAAGATASAAAAAAAAAAAIPDAEQVCFRCREYGHVASACEQRAVEDESKEVAAVLEEEHITLDARPLDTLTDRPVSEDVLLFAIPMCGPRASLAHAKFRVRVTPGSQKKGKATREVVKHFTRSKVCSERERFLMRSVQDAELGQPMCNGGVELSFDEEGGGGGRGGKRGKSKGKHGKHGKKMGKPKKNNKRSARRG